MTHVKSENMIIGCMSKSRLFANRLVKRLVSFFPEVPLIILMDDYDVMPQKDVPFFISLQKADQLIAHTLKRIRFTEGKKICEIAFGIGRRVRSPGQLRNLLGWLCLRQSIMLEKARSDQRVIVVFFDDDMVPNAFTVSSLVNPLIDGKADITYGPCIGKPPFPIPENSHRCWKEEKNIFKRLLFHECNMNISSHKASLIINELIANRGMTVNEPLTGFVKTKTYAGGNSARTSEVLSNIPCAPSLARKGDDVIPGWVSSGLDYEIRLVFGACIRHLFVRKPAFRKGIADMLFANDFENTIIKLLQMYRSGISDATKDVMDLGFWILRNKRLLLSKEFIQFRQKYYKKYLNAVSKFNSVFGELIFLPTFEALQESNNGSFIEYALLLSTFSKFMEMSRRRFS